MIALNRTYKILVSQCSTISKMVKTQEAASEASHTSFLVVATFACKDQLSSIRAGLIDCVFSGLIAKKINLIEF